MDTVSGHTNHTPPPPPPHSSTGDIPPPHITTSINQLRSFSTSLQTFITAYDDLHSHINFINSSINSILPRHLVETASHMSLTKSLLEFNYDETIKGSLVSEQNPGESVTLDKQYSKENNNSLKDCEETVLEGSCDDDQTITAVVMEDIVLEQNPREVDMLQKQYKESESLKECEETVLEGSCDDQITIDVTETVLEGSCDEQNTKESVILQKQYKETESLKDCMETVLEGSCDDKTTKVFTEDNVSEQNPNGMVMDCERTEFLMDCEETDALKDAEIVDVLESVKETVLEGSCDDQTTTVFIEDNISEQNLNGMVMDYERTEYMQDCEETDALKDVEVVDVFENCEETVPESLCDRAATVVPEVVVSEQNADGMATDCETARMCENDEHMQDYEEPDACCEGIDALQKHVESDATDCEGRYEIVRMTGNDEFLEDKDDEEADVLDKLEVVNVLKSYEEGYTCEGVEGLHKHEAVVSEQYHKGMGTDCEGRYETERTTKNDEYLEDYKEIVALHEHEEIVAFKKHEITVSDSDQSVNDVSEVIASEQNPNGMVTDCEGRYETERTTENNEYLEDCEGSNALNKLEVVDVRNNCEGVDGLHEHEETDALKKHEITVAEASCDQVVSDENVRIHEVTDGAEKHIETVPESICDQSTTVDSEQSPNGMATDSEFLQIYGESDALKKLEVVDVSRNIEKIYTCEGTDALQNHDALMKPGEAVKESLCDQTVTDVSKAVVSEQNANGMDSDCEGRYETARMTEKAESMQDYEESDDLNKLEVDVLENSEEIYTCEESNELQKHVETDALKKDEESVPESFCKQTTTDVTEAVVSEQNDNRMVANGEQSHEHVRIPETLYEFDVLKQPEQTDICKNSEGTVVLKESEGLDTLMISKAIDEPEEYVPETYCDQTITAVAEPIVPELNPSGMDANGEQSCENLRIPDSVEEIEIDTSMIPVEIDTSKKPEENVPETSCDQTTPSVPDAIVSEHIHKRMATNCETSHGNVSKKRAVIDTTPKQNDILKKFKHTDLDTSKNREATVVKKKHVEINTLKNHKEIDTLKKHEKTGTYKKSVISKLEYLCKSMKSKGLKWHVARHFSEMTNLRTEIAEAIKLAEDPAKLVLDSIGRFYLQGIRTFCKDSGTYQDEQNQGRMAAILILECFVMISSDGIEIANRDQEYAAQAAVDWRKRMLREGRLRHAEEVDARGLLLLISGFGIQDRYFKIEDIMDLIRASNVKGISAALCCSVFLVRKIPEVTEFMVKKNLEIEAADLAYTFGLEDKCHPRSILASFLRNNIKNIPKGSRKLGEMKQQLLDLKAVKQCLEAHNIDPATYLPDFKINRTIQCLEKELNGAKLMKKRKPLERPMHKEAKRACSGHENMPRHRNPADHYGIDQRYRSTKMSTSYFDSDQDLLRCYISNHSTSSVYNTPAICETVTGPMLNGFHGSYDNVPHSASVQPYGLHDPNAQHYLRHGQAYVTQPYGRGRPSERGPPEAYPPIHQSGRRGPSSGLYGFADVVERETRGFHA